MRRWLVIGAGAVGAAAIGLPAGYLTAQYVDQPSVVGFAPGDGMVTNQASPAIKLDIDNPDNVDELRVVVDGKDVTAKLKALPDGFALEGVALEDGEHRVELQGKGTGLFGQRLTGDWHILVDTTKPELAVTSPAQKKWQKKPIVRGRSEPGIRIEIAYPGGKVQGEAGADGKFAIPLPVDPGRHQLHITAIDDAGNRIERQRLLRYDDAAPEVVVRGAKGWSTQSTPLIMGTLRDTSKTTLTATLDGKPVEVEQTSVGFVLPTKQPLYEGLHTLEVTARDTLGQVTKVKKTWGVDTTEQLRPFVALGLGARGKDVQSLTRRLRVEGFWKGNARKRYDAKVQAAVDAYARAHGQQVTGRTNPIMVRETEGKLVVEKSKFKLTVYRDGKKISTYQVAIGQPAYPSPTGTYEVIEMYKNPTWIPPNSPWAKGLEPIPPGPGNPLGTRWIGTSAPAVGFHGTPQDWSIGTAASHGCVRMHIPDVEKLYEQVKVGWGVEFKD
jgi:lipoprotein-anchoring transpeptidase ErfK/SrfK